MEEAQGIPTLKEETVSTSTTRSLGPPVLVVKKYKALLETLREATSPSTDQN